MRLPILCVLAVAPLVAQATPEQRFLDALSQAEALAARGSFQRALAQLDTALAAHAEQDYVRRRRVEIEVLHARCAFRAANPTPDPKSLVAGDLLSCDLATGQIRLRYRRDQRDDWREQDGTLLHDARFVGPVTLELSGERFDVDTPDRSAAPVLVLCADSERRIELRLPFLGADVPDLARVVGKERLVLAAASERPTRLAQPYRLTVKVTDALVACSWNGVLFLSAKKDRREVGRLGVRGLVWDEAILEGRVDPAWLTGRCDDAMDERLRRFERGYSARRALPAWLYWRGAPFSAESDDDAWPDTLDEAQKELVRGVERTFRRRDLKEGLAYVQSLPESALPAATRAALVLIFETELRQYGAAGRSAERLALLAPRSPVAGALRAELAIACGDGQRAALLLGPVVADRPRCERWQVDLALARMTLGQLDEARRGVDEALAQGASGSEIERMKRTLVRAMRGPEWARDHVFRSPSFEVHSDVDAKSCQQIAELLESTLSLCRAQLGPVDAPKSRFKVFLFSGHAGFQRYLRDLWGERVCMQAAGIYEPLLKQLLIWNTPSRAELFATVRHECLHQYLDRAMRCPPVWFDEGLAGGFERAARGDGALDDAERARLALLARQGLLPLRELTALSAESFYGDSERAYAQAWAFVRLLRERHRPRFEGLLRDLRGGAIPEDAHRAAFEGIAWEELDRELLAYVQALK